MITLKKVQIYQKYNGDIDFWARAGSKKEQLIMNDNDWYIIDSILQDLELISNNKASLEYSNSFNSKLKQYCDTDETIKLLVKLSS